MTQPDQYERVRLMLREPFSVELQRLIDIPPMGSRPMEITPEKAAEMLKRNDNNRPISEFTWRMWGTIMRNGKWLHTGEPIIFSKRGRLLQGQHRLLGCLNYETAFMVDVVFGKDEEIFSVLDTGKKRTCADIFSINGVKNSVLMAASVLWVIGYNRGGFTKPTGGTPDARMSNADILREYEKYTDLQSSMWVARSFSKNRFAAPALMTALHYICAQKCRRDADAFFKIVADGYGDMKKNNPALMFRNKLIDNLRHHERLTNRAIGALTISAWNLYRDGHSGRNIRFNPERPFPRAR